MTTYFQDGGFSMYIILIVAVAAAALAVVRKGEARAKTLWVGSYGCLIAGVFGMATGMVAVSRHIGRFTGDKGEIVAIGLGELSNNGTFATLLATLLAAAAIFLAPKPKTA